MVQEKFAVWVDKETHRLIKRRALGSNVTMSEYMRRRFVEKNLE